MNAAKVFKILTCWWKTLGLLGSPGPILLPRVSPIVRTFHSGFNGSSNHVSLASRDNLYTLSHRPQSFSVQRARERKMNMPGLQLGMMNYIWDMQTIYLSTVHMAPAFPALLCSTTFYACLWLRKKRSISCGLSISQTTESDANAFSSVLLCIFLSK